MVNDHQLKFLCVSDKIARQVEEWELLANNLLGMDDFAILLVSPNLADLQPCMGTRIPTAFLELCQTYLSRQPHHFLEQEIVWREGVSASPEAATLDARFYLRYPLRVWGEVAGILVMAWKDNLSKQSEAAGFAHFIRWSVEALIEKTLLVGENQSLRDLQESILRERAQLQTILDHVRMPIMLFNKHSRLVVANPEAYRVAERLGIHLTDYVGQRIDDLIALLPDNAELPNDFGVGKTQEIKIEGAGEFLMRAAEVISIDNQVEGYVVVGQEITEERDLDRNRSELLSLLSHDLGNILGLALGYTTLLLDEKLENEEHRLFVERVYEALSRGKTLIRDVVEIENARTRGLQIMKPYNLLECLQQVMAALMDMVKVHRQNLELEVIKQPLMMLEGNSILIKQAFENLITNAIKYTPDGGQVTVRVNTNNDYVIVSVEDTGIGIPEDALPHIFERAYRVKSAQTHNIQGSGLGLYLVKWVVEAHGGWIEVESEVGKGSIFRVYLPYPMGQP